VRVPSGFRSELRVDIDSRGSVGSSCSGGDTVDLCRPAPDDHRRVRDARAVRIEDGDVERLLARGRHLRLRLRVELCRGQPIDVADHPHHYAEARDADDERDNQPDR